MIKITNSKNKSSIEVYTEEEMKVDYENFDLNHLDNVKKAIEEAKEVLKDLDEKAQVAIIANSFLQTTDEFICFNSFEPGTKKICYIGNNKVEEPIRTLFQLEGPIRALLQLKDDISAFI